MDWDKYFWETILNLCFLSFILRTDISINPFEGSTSTNSISAPQYNAQFADATNDIGDVQTMSPLVTPNDKHAR